MRVEAGGHDSLLSDFPTPYLTHVDIVEAGLLSIDSDVLSAASTVESARFMNNRIAYIDADAFRLAATVAGSSFRQDERGCGCTQPSFVPRPIHACAAFQSSLFFLAEVPRPELQLTHRGAPGFPRPHVGPRLAQPSQVRPTSHSTVKSKGRPGKGDRVTAQRARCSSRLDSHRDALSIEKGRLNPTETAPLFLLQRKRSSLLIAAMATFFISVDLAPLQQGKI